MDGAGQRKWWALGAVSLCILAVSLDGTVLSVALPTLATALHASASDLEWFSSGYLLTLAATVLPAGLIGDRYGRKRLLVGSLALFGAGSALCAYAPSPALFLTARLVMGVAGAGVTVMALSALTVLFTDEERPRAVGIYEAANFLALPLGPILGGWMLSRLWWGWVFLINVPIVVIGVTVALALVPESRADERPGLDVVGVAASTAGLVALTYGLVGAGEHGWGDFTSVIAMIVGLLLLAGFVFWQRQLAARGGQPLIDPALFSSRSFTWGAALSGMAGLGMVGLLFVMPQYFQAVDNVDTFGSGLRLLPLVVGLIVGAAPAGSLVKVIGAKLTVAAGFVLIAVGACLGAATGVGSSEVFVAAWMVVLCAGTGLALTAATAAALARLSKEASGVGSAVVQAFQKTSAPLGTAISGSVVAAAYTAHLHLPPLSADQAAAVRHSVYNGVTIAQQVGSASLGTEVRAAFVHGLGISMITAGAIAVASLVATLVFLPGLPQRHSEQSADRQVVHANRN